MTEGITYDPAEVVLLAVGPFQGLELGDRVTAKDLEDIVRGDNVLNPFDSTKPKSEIYLDAMKGKISSEQFISFDGTFPLLERHGKFVFGGEEFVLRFSLYADIPKPGETTPGQINSVVRNGCYLWSFDVSESDPLATQSEGRDIFGVGVDKIITAEGNTEDKVAGTEGNEEGSVCYLGLDARLQEFARRYPKGCTVDPIEYTLGFLRVIGNQDIEPS